MKKAHFANALHLSDLPYYWRSAWYVKAVVIRLLPSVEEINGYLEREEAVPAGWVAVITVWEADPPEDLLGDRVPLVIQAPIRTERGAIRVWKSLDTLVGSLRAQGVSMAGITLAEMPVSTASELLSVTKGLAGSE